MPPSPFEAAFDPEAFRREGKQLVDRLADYLESALSVHGIPVLPPQRIERLRASFPALGPAEDSLDTLVTRIVDASIHLHHPRYVGHQVPPPLPRAALVELVSSLLNNSGAVFEMSPVGTVLEERVIEWMAGRVGYGRYADGILTSGGSLGNLTALLAARAQRAGYDAWNEGVSRESPLVFFASSAAHYGVTRAAHVMGLGREGVVLVESDERHHMRVDSLAKAVKDARAAKKKPFAVVASACTTALGAFDPLGAIADLCAREELHLHVDGAHGAAAVLSPKYRSLVAGIERADSIVWDAHKMLLVPSLATGVLFRDGAVSYDTFSQDASYLLGQKPEHEPQNRGHRTFECTKSTMALKVYAALAIHGEAMFDDFVTRAFDLARSFAAHVAADPDFELAVAPEANIVCLRFLGRSLGGYADEQLDEVQDELRGRILSTGSFYLVKARAFGKLWLRVTLMNPFTTLGELDELMDALRAAARGLPKR